MSQGKIDLDRICENRYLLPTYYPARHNTMQTRINDFEIRITEQAKLRMIILALERS